MSARTITGSLSAYLSKYSGPDALLKGDDAAAIRSIAWISSADRAHWEAQGYTYLGEATVTFAAPGEVEMIDSKVMALRAERIQVLADAQLRATKLEGDIQKLLAIANEVQS